MINRDALTTSYKYQATISFLNERYFRKFFLQILQVSE